MSNLLKTELYKLFHSWYFWGIGIFNLFLSTILLLDSKGKSSNLIMASLYNVPFIMAHLSRQISKMFLMNQIFTIV